MRERKPKRIKLRNEDIPESLKTQPDENTDGHLQSVSAAQSAQRKGNSKGAFAAGIFIILFAIAGLAFTVYFAVTAIIAEVSDKDYSQYAAYTVPVAAVDPKTFDDISSAQMPELLNIALWTIVSSDTAPDRYKYDGGNMLIPEADAEEAFKSLFSDEIKPEHQSIEGFGYEFTYDKTNKVYKIPLTAITPIYTPDITDVKVQNSSVILTVGMINFDSWETDKNGKMVTPEPDKYIKITLLERSGSYYISAIQSASAAPEAVNVPVQENNTNAGK